MDDRLGDGINESWKIAQRGHEITQALRVLNTTDAERELAELTSRTSPDRRPDRGRGQPARGAPITGRRRQSAPCDRAVRPRSTPVLDARFDELVARAIEVSVGAGDSELLGNDVDGLVTELEALRMAIDETAVAAGGPVELPVAGPAPRSDPS